MEQYTVKIDNAPYINFTGELIAETSSRCDQSERWTELRLYKTRGGKFICHSIGRTTIQSEHDRFNGAVCGNVLEVCAFFGHRWLAKRLYRAAGICDVVTVE